MDFFSKGYCPTCVPWKVYPKSFEYFFYPLDFSFSSTWAPFFLLLTRNMHLRMPITFFSHGRHFSCTTWTCVRRYIGMPGWLPGWLLDPGNSFPSYVCQTASQLACLSHLCKVFWLLSSVRRQHFKWLVAAQRKPLFFRTSVLSLPSNNEYFPNISNIKME